MTRMATLIIAIGSIAALAQGPRRAPVPAPSADRPGGADAAVAWQTLDQGLADSDPDHRTKALTAVGTIGNLPQGLTRAENGLRDKNLEVRQTAATALGDMGSSDAIPSLRMALDDESPEVSFTAAKSLSSLGDYEDADAILWQVITGDRKDAPTFKQRVGREAKKKLTPAQIALMGAKEAAGLLGPGSFGVDAVAEAIKASKGGGGAPGRVVAAGNLSKDSTPYTLALLEWALDDSQWTVRTAVAKALGERGNQATIAKLLPRLSDDHHAVRYMAAASIIKLSLRPGSEAR